MEAHDVEIEIGKYGKVRVHVKGAKGKACIAYAKLIEQIVGREESRELTSEYYEPDAHVDSLGLISSPAPRHSVTSVTRGATQKSIDLRLDARAEDR